MTEQKTIPELKTAEGLNAHGLRTIQLENSLLRIVILPHAGAKIEQITYKPLHADLLWRHPHIAPAHHPLGAPYDDLWSGGWDELFPNDEPCVLDGRPLPDHGELWTGDWEAMPFERDDAAGVYLRHFTPVSRFLVERTLTLRPSSAAFEIHYRFTNRGDQPFPFLWKLHPAFAVTPSHRIDFPPMAVVREPGFPGTLADAPPMFPWPHATLGNRTLDLRQVPDADSGALHFFYGAGFVSGWCGITNRANQLACGLRFDPDVFSSCWLFATHGGWQGLNVAVLEPATGFPFRMDQMIAAGRARTLAPGASLETTVLFSAQQGLDSIGGITDDGLILPGDAD